MATITTYKLLDDDSTLEQCHLHPILLKKPVSEASAAGPGSGGIIVKALHCPPQPHGVPVGAFNSDMVYARELTIIHGGNPSYWNWKWLPEAPDVEAAALSKVCWLEVKGTYDMKMLAPGKRYEFFFVIKIENNIDFDSPVKFELELPDGWKKSREVNLMKLEPKNSWVLVRLAEVVGTWNGEIKFSLVNFTGCWKKGITVAGVRIDPVY